MNALENYEIYKPTKSKPNDILNEELYFESNILYDTVLAIEPK